MAENLVPANELAKKNKIRNPNESSEYREARNRLLAEEIELRRYMERVAQMRRQLPLGGEVPADYQFVGKSGPIKLSELFGKHDTLVVYSYMFGPKRETPCPMCTSFMRAWSTKIQDAHERASLVFVARSPIEKLLTDKPKRGLEALPVYSDKDGNYTRTYVSAEDEDWAGLNVFVKRNGKIHHFWRDEISFEMADPGQDPRGAADFDALWKLLDLTPEGRGTDWYPKLSDVRSPQL